MQPSIKFLFISFIISQLGLIPAASALTLPSELGQIQKKSEGKNGRTLLLIQEVHVNYEVQKSIAEILRYAAEKENLRLILVEGGWGDVSLSYLRSYTTPEGRREVSDRYLKEGKISGEEWLDVTSDLDLKLRGIENQDFYTESMNAFLKVHDAQEKLDRELEKLNKDLGRDQKKIFSKELRELLQKKADFDDQKLSIADYVQMLAPHPALSPRGGEDKGEGAFAISYPHLAKLLTLTGAHASVDPEKIEWNKHEVIKALSRRLTKPEIEMLQVMVDRKNPEDEIRFFHALLTAGERFKDLKKNSSYKNLESYSRALEEVTNTDSAKLFAELNALEDSVLNTLAQTPESKSLLEKTRFAASLKKLFELKMTPDEFAKFRGAWLPAEPGSDSLKAAIPDAVAFYTAARKREQAMIMNAFAELAKESDSLVALITGGFHTEAMIEEFKKAGYTVLLVTPRFEMKDSAENQEKYFEIMKLKWGNPGPSSPFTAHSSQFSAQSSELKGKV